MKLSLKFFSIAYLTALLSLGLGGSCVIQSINDLLWNAQMERVNSAVQYAADSFLVFADLSYGELSETEKQEVIRQIKGSMDRSVNQVEIRNRHEVPKTYQSVEENQCVASFFEKDHRILMESVCRLNVGTKDYYLFVSSDFTELRAQRNLLWDRYGIFVLCISIGIGLILFILARRMTKPLNLLARQADEIALGNYGKTVSLKGAKDEIYDLSKSVNSMSLAIERNVREIQEELKRRNRFVADFTHEMKTPMTSIMGYAQILCSYDLEPAEKKQAAEAIHWEAKRLEKLSLQLLELYLYQNEAVEMEEIYLSELEKQLKYHFLPFSEQHNVRLWIHLEEETVQGNGVLLLSLLCNLTENAIKASFEKGVVRVFSQSAAERVIITVEDEGRGIAKENLQRITEPFFREDKSRSRKFGGAGLGLALCKKIAEIHGTDLFFESERNKGTRVSFSLPKGGEKK